jgi:hypothetical protein
MPIMPSMPGSGTAVPPVVVPPVVVPPVVVPPVVVPPVVVPPVVVPPVVVPPVVVVVPPVVVLPQVPLPAVWPQLQKWVCFSWALAGAANATVALSAASSAILRFMA